MPDYILHRKSFVPKFQLKRKREGVHQKVPLALLLFCDMITYVIYMLW